MRAHLIENKDALDEVCVADSEVAFGAQHAEQALACLLPHCILLIHLGVVM
jgi:hypothetical protein